MTTSDSGGMNELPQVDFSKKNKTFLPIILCLSLYCLSLTVNNNSKKSRVRQCRGSPRCPQARSGSARPLDATLKPGPTRWIGRTNTPHLQLSLSPLRHLPQSVSRWRTLNSPITRGAQFEHACFTACRTRGSCRLGEQQHQRLTLQREETACFTCIAM